MDAKALRSDKEQTLRPLVIALSILCWIGLVVSIVGAIYGLFIAAFIAVAHAMFMSHVRGNGLKLGPDQLPHVWQKVVRAADRLGLREPPEAYVLQSGGILNAFATRVLGRRFVVIYSQLLEACDQRGERSEPRSSREPGASGLPDVEELDFIIGHEVGHLACGHVSWFLLPARVFPLLGHAWSRACEYTADRCGQYLTDNVDVSCRALAILAAGPKAAREVNLDAFEAQRNESGDFWMAVYELNVSHPYLPKRVAALRNQTAAPISRNFLSYPLAPMLAFGVEGPAAGMAMVFVIAMLAAIALPAFEKYQKRAAELTAAPVTLVQPPAASQVNGERFAWHMSAPGPKWETLTGTETRQRNADADRWLTRPDLDAHLIVIGEYLGGAPLSMDAFARGVIANMKRTSPKFKVSRQEDRPDGTRIILAESTIDGRPLSHLYELRIDGDYAYQLLALAPAASMPKVRDEVMYAMASFSPAKDKQ